MFNLPNGTAKWLKAMEEIEERNKSAQERLEKGFNENFLKVNHSRNFIVVEFGFSITRCGKKTKNNPNPLTKKELVTIAKKTAKLYKEPMDVIEKATYKQLCNYLYKAEPIIIKKKITDTVNFSVEGGVLTMKIKKSTLNKLKIKMGNNASSSKKSKSSNSRSSSDSRHVIITHKISGII